MSATIRPHPVLRADPALPGTRETEIYLADCYDGTELAGVERTLRDIDGVKYAGLDRTRNVVRMVIDTQRTSADQIVANRGWW